MQAAVPDGSYELRLVDVSSLASVREFADGAPERIDLLINNAGVMAPPTARPSTASRCNSAPITSATSPSPGCCWAISRRPTRRAW